MLVLTRPAPKPVPQPSPPSTPPQPQLQQSPTTPDPISLRPLGRTGSGSTLIPSPLTLPKPDREYSPSPSPSPKSGRFVPPHLRPGFAGREEKPGPQQGARSRENPVEMNRPDNSVYWVMGEIVGNLEYFRWEACFLESLMIMPEVLPKVVGA
ncbi:hypothetical protein RHSIM_Rhsim06G0135700 [Rhododendron simsii]|uniref:Uncharacterized protein n=1 Tax=Rhododendron simsii TaxID=118357 RepID=A0A834LLN5_RHOSS|nr:hypothetical protein RHSIM_Rhsim06G0135700 [Rhododendron simsii]